MNFAAFVKEKLQTTLAEDAANAFVETAIFTTGSA